MELTLEVLQQFIGGSCGITEFSGHATFGKITDVKQRSDLLILCVDCEFQVVKGSHVIPYIIDPKHCGWFALDDYFFILDKKNDRALVLRHRHKIN